MDRVERTSHRSESAFRRWIARLARVAALLLAVALIFRLTGCMERLFYHPSTGPTPVPQGISGGEKVTFASRDGTSLCGWFVPAQGVDSRDALSVLHVHGNAGNMNDHIWFTEFLPEAGMNLFIFDYRGYGESEGTARTRQGLIDDTHAALDHLLTRADVNPGAIAMYGQSLGGSIGLNVMAERAEIRGAVIESAFASWRDIAANALGGDPAAWWARMLAWTLISDRDRPDQAIARVAPRPLLIAHGVADRIVPISHGRRLASAGGPTVTLVEYAGGEHNSLRESHPEYSQAVIEFFRSLAAE